MNVSVSTKVNAPLERVFHSVSGIQEMARVFPDQVEYEILTEQQMGAGSRFREFRTIGKRKDVLDMDVTEWVENDRVRMVTDRAGSVWDTLISVKPDGDGTLLTFAIDVRPHHVFARMMNFVMKPWLLKGGREEVEKIKAYCERQAAAAR